MIALSDYLVLGGILFSIAVAVVVLVGVTVALQRVGQWQTDERTTAKVDMLSLDTKGRVPEADGTHRRSAPANGSRGYRVDHDEIHAEDFAVGSPEMTVHDEQNLTIAAAEVELSREGVGDSPFGGDLRYEGTGQPPAPLDADDGSLLDQVIAESGGHIDAVQQRQKTLYKI